MSSQSLEDFLPTITGRISFDQKIDGLLLGNQSDSGKSPDGFSHHFLATENHSLDHDFVESFGKITFPGNISL